MWQITAEVLEVLGDTGILVSGGNLTYLHIYGQDGKMGHFFSQAWQSADDMRSALSQNHGGGVPVDVIEKLVMASKVNDSKV